MSLFGGILKVDSTKPLNLINDADLTSAMNAVLEKYQQARDEAQNLFVVEQTTKPSERVVLAGYDEGQTLGPDGRPIETHTAGDFTVAYPIIRLGWALGWNEETYARKTVADLDREVAAKTAGNAKRHAREILKAIGNNANYTYKDVDYGDLTIRRLANSDGTLYPAAVNSDTEAEDNHYLVSGYAAGSISPTNNPFVTLAAEVREHVDLAAPVVAFINSAQRIQVLTGITNFVDTPVTGISPAYGEQVASELAGVNVPGTFLGVDPNSGAYVYIWDRVPDGYIVAGVVGADAPVKRRIPEYASLAGFRLVDEQKNWPFWKQTWVERFGYGVANRLGFAVMQLTTNGSYTTPAAWS